MSGRVGLGLDAHRLEPGRPLMLGTIQIDHPEGLAGHSDGDVVAHALCDALLSALGDDDIGVVFPGTPDWAGVTGERMLQVVAARVAEAGYVVVNAHAVVICEAPKLAPYRQAIQAALTAIVGAPVTMHATTTDGMGATGRGEGIACQAVALVEAV